MADLINETLTGTASDDSFDFTGNGNTVYAGAGNDSIGVSGNNNTLNGEAGTDMIGVFGNNNVLNGGPDDDILYALDNNNTLNGGAGDDRLESYGDNTLNGGDGNDSLIAMEGNNILNGGAGDDMLSGVDSTIGQDVFQFSFTLDKAPGEAKTFTFTDWLSEKYGKDFGDHLPDFQGGHDHHRHGHHGRDDHRHGRHDEHGKDGHHHHHHYAHHGSHHQPHGDCHDHQPQHGGLSESFFASNYMEWLREVVVPDLQERGLAHDDNGNGKIDVCLDAKDPGGTPHIEGLSDEQLAQLFGDRDEVTVKDGHHGENLWYSNSYTSSSGEGETTVASTDGHDTALGFDLNVDQLEFDGLSGLSLDDFQSLFTLDLDTATNVMTLGLADDSWSVAFTDLSDTAFTLTDIYNDSVFA